MAHAGLAQKARQVTAPAAVISSTTTCLPQRSVDAVKVNGDALIAVAVVLNQRTYGPAGQSGHKAAGFRVFKAGNTSPLVFQLQFVDAKCDEVGDVRRAGYPRRGLNFIPCHSGGLWLAVAIIRPALPGRQSVSLIESQRWRGHIARANITRSRWPGRSHDQRVTTSELRRVSCR
jgi:hypothetical protein